MPEDNCPICLSPAESCFTQPNYHFIRCNRCSEYVISDYAKDSIQLALELDGYGIDHYAKIDSAKSEDREALCIEVAKKASSGKGIDVPRSIISHVLSKRLNKRAPITTDILINVLRSNSLPTPAEQANNFISFLGEYLSSPGSSYAVPTPQISDSRQDIYGLLGRKTGEREWQDLHFVITSLEDENMIRVNYQGAMKPADRRMIPLNVSLTLVGWQKYEELKRSVKESRRAFVAMEFFNPDNKEKNYFFQTTLLDKYLVPAVREAGYEASNALRSEPKAGNIHARLEVEIRASRFIIAELSHHNNGAYWEAGFARGIEKPIIYMYSPKIGKSPRPHFDVGADYIIFWDEEQPDKAAEELKAVIRATLYGEAKTDNG